MVAILLQFYRDELVCFYNPHTTQQMPASCRWFLMVGQQTGQLTKAELYCQLFQLEIEEREKRRHIKRKIHILIFQSLWQIIDMRLKKKCSEAVKYKILPKSFFQN